MSFNGSRIPYPALNPITAPFNNLPPHTLNNTLLQHQMKSKIDDQQKQFLKRGGKNVDNKKVIYDPRAVLNSYNEVYNNTTKPRPDYEKVYADRLQTGQY